MWWKFLIAFYLAWAFGTIVLRVARVALGVLVWVARVAIVILIIVVLVAMIRAL